MQGVSQEEKKGEGEIAKELQIGRSCKGKEILNSRVGMPTGLGVRGGAGGGLEGYVGTQDF